jgi:hypothetical protein
MSHLIFDRKTSVNDAVAAAYREAGRVNQHVLIQYDGFYAVACSSSTPEDTVNDLTRQIRERRERVSEQARRAREHAPAQKQINALMAKLPKVLNSRDHGMLVSWIGEFAAINDNSYLKFDKKKLCQSFVTAGYSEDDCDVDEQPADRPKHEKEARSIVGNAISLLRMDFPIHPIAVDFAKKYHRRNRKVLSAANQQISKKKTSTAKKSAGRKTPGKT